MRPPCAIFSKSALTLKRVPFEGSVWSDTRYWFRKPDTSSDAGAMTLFPSCSDTITDSCLTACLRRRSFSSLNGGDSSGLQPEADAATMIKRIGPMRVERERRSLLERSGLVIRTTPTEIKAWTLDPGPDSRALSE